MRRQRWTLSVFVLLALLHLALHWSVRYIPTGDGPTHVYNSWILHGLITGDAPSNIARAYRIDSKPHPNWSGHVLMASAMAIVSPLIAEKLLVTLILVLMLAGTWLLATSVDPRNDVYAFLAFPFLWTQTLFAGYYNFSLSIGLYLLILALWWRRRERASIASIATLALLLVLCYFTHPMAAGLACGSIVLLSLLTRSFRQLIAIAPTLPLLALFGGTSQSNVGAPLQLRINWDAARILAQFDALYPFDLRHRPIAIATTIAFVALIVITLVKERSHRRDANALGLLALALMAMMFWIPAAQGTRDLFTGRMPAFLYLILPAWFTPRLGKRSRIALVVALAIIAIGNAAITFDRIRFHGREIERMVRAFDVIERESSMLPLFYERPTSHSLVNVYAHFPSYVALERRLVDLANYEPGVGYFPIANRGPSISVYIVETQPGAVDLDVPGARAEFVLTHGDPGNAPNRNTLRERYRLVREWNGFRLHRRAAPPAGARELLLLPLLGTREPLGAPGGARWAIDQSLHNRSDKPMRVLFRTCLDDLWCDRELAAGVVLPIETAGRFAFLEVPRDFTDQLDVSTVVRRADVVRPETSIAIPAAREREFARGATSIGPLAIEGQKLGLRFYVFGEQPFHDVTVRFRASDDQRSLGERRMSVENFGMYADAQLQTAIVDAPPSIHLEIDVPDDARVWALVTLTDANGRAHVITSTTR